MTTELTPIHNALDAIDAETTARQLHECHDLLLTLATSRRPTPGGFQQLAMDLLVRHGVVCTPEADPPETTPEKSFGHVADGWRKGA